MPHDFDFLDLAGPFHLDCLASEVRLNVDLDAAMTVIANGCYRWLGSKLRGCSTMA